MTDEAIRAICDKFMSGLDGHQPAESAAEDKDGPDPQGTACHIKEHAKPSNDLAIEKPPAPPLGIGWHISA